MITKLIVWSSIAIQKVMSGTEKFFQYPTLLFCISLSNSNEFILFRAYSDSRCVINGMRTVT